MLSFIVMPAMVGVMGVARIAAGLDTAVYSICSGSNATTDIGTLRALPCHSVFLAFALASALCLRASGVAVWCFGRCAGIRVLPSCFRRRRLVFWPLRWHPRFAFVRQALPFGVLAVALASALCLRASGVAVFGVLAVALASTLCLRTSSVAPVRGGTYFSLPPQRKVGKRKRLTPPTFFPA
ncbi:hypothetical protein [Paraburkholderia terrae]|uniref:hypothetical protein n=1 Tax=Paraburkholderia terrae TaxID=311230 RepID=UPI003365A9F1